MCALFARKNKKESKTGGALNPADEFLREFEAEEEELTVLLKGYTKGGWIKEDLKGDYVFPAAAFMAYIDNQSGEIIQEQGTLNWVAQRSSNKSIYNFKDCGIYRVLVRRSKPDVMNLSGKPYKNRYYLVKILKKNLKEPRLEAILAEYLKPVSIEDKAGTFRLDRKYGWFEGEIDWLGSSEEVRLKQDEGSDTAVNALRTLHRFLEDAEQWDKTLRTFAARQLTGLANDWQDEDTHQITEEEFAQRIGIPSFLIDGEGDFEVTYDDDDMFYGHWIVVYGSADGELKDAEIEG